MSPLRWDVLAVSFLLALPVLALGLQGTFTVEEMTGKLPWCFAAGWGVVALLRWASQPRNSSPVAVAHNVHADDEAPTPV
jgi:ferredoxin-NADP reductase